jgi:hypothetical protein
MDCRDKPDKPMTWDECQWDVAYRRSTTMPRRFACGMKQTSGMFGGWQD